MEDERFARGLGAQLLCTECRLAPPEFVRAVSFGLYARELRALIALLKFARVRPVAKLLGRRLGEAILQLEGRAASDLLVVAVPLFGQRQRERQFNQSTLLADEALRWLRRARPDWRLTPAHAALVRRRSTESSFSLSRRDRRRNMAGAFRVAGDVLGREVLLVDDVMTSGATVRECSRVLVKAGATRVWVATLARSRRDFGELSEQAEEQVAMWDLPTPNRVS